MPDPIIQKLPETTTALTNKYRRNPNIYNGAPTPISNALIALDIERTQKGQNPLSKRQTLLALQAATTGNAVTPPPDHSFLGSITSDLGAIVKSIPRLPVAMYHELQALKDTPEALRKALATPGSPLDKISAAAQAPGIRLFPGSYIASNLNNPGELANHPLFTLLDILPGKEIPVIKRNLPKVTTPIKSTITPAIRQLGATRPGEFLQEAFGTQARDTAQSEAIKSSEMREAAYGTGAISNLPQWAQEATADLVRQAGTLRKQYPSISEDRRIELTRLMSEDDMSIRNLSGDELAYVNDARRITDQLGQYGVSQGLLTDIGGELFDNDTAARIMRARRAGAIAGDYGDVRESIITPDATTLPDKITDVTKKEYLKPNGKVKLIEGYAHALQNAGIDARPIFDRLREYRNTKSPLKYSDDDFSTWWESERNNLQPARQVDLDAFIDQLKKHSKTDPLAARMLDHVKAGRFQEAQALAKQAGRRKVYGIPDIDDLVYALEAPKQQARYFRTISKWDETRVRKLQTRAARTENMASPARFQGLIERKTQEAITAYAKARLITDPDWDNIFAALEARNYGWLSRHGYIPEPELRAIQNDIRATWKDMKAAGHDPVFVHRVSEKQLGSILYPRVLERIPRPSQVNKRSWNITPAITDVSVAMTHQGLEWLARRGSEEFINEILTKFATTQGELIDRYLPAARRAAKTPTDELAVAERLMNREWQKYDPTGVINWPSARIKRWSDEEIWLPKTVANTIQRMHVPPAGRMTALYDPIMNVFRTSLLPLSPRWHVYNILGGGMMLTAGAGPSSWRFLKQAYNMARSGDVPENVPRGMGTVPRDTLEWSSKGSIQRPLEVVFHYKGGQTLRRLWDEIQKARGTFQKGIDASYRWNGFVDDMYRTMAYLNGQDKALTKGLTTEQAQKAGVELARKVFQQWDRMTPLERSIMRFIMPFYGWTSHVAKFVLQYPVDHPIRTAIMGSFARNELDDLGSGLGERFLNMFFLGDMDPNGNVKTLNLAGMNPFSDVANTFTLSGFLGQTNPLITTAFKSAGVDVANGGPELFPSMTYDSESGRLAFRSRNPLMILGESILPQSRVLLGFADSSSEFQQLLRTNPDAAGRMLLSQAGIPIIFRNVNVPQEQAKAEVARDEAQSKVLNEALKSGDWDTAKTYPGLRPLLGQLAQLQKEGKLTTLQPESSGQSAIRMAQEALSKQLSAIPGIGG